MTTWFGRCLAAAMLSSLVAAPALSATGETVAVVQRAVINSNGTTVTLDKGRPVGLGDTIATGETGEAQIIFPDQTRIVVGPNSQITISRLMFRDNGTARRLSVNAVRGTFRFLSGESPSRAYRIRTPTATMGVRGTEFDFAVAGREETDLVVYAGQVQFCTGGRCASVPGGCQAVRINRRGGFSQPETADERAQTLSERFPYATNQDRLNPAFRTLTDECRNGGRDTTASARIRQIALPSSASNADEPSNDKPASESSGNPAD